MKAAIQSSENLVVISAGPGTGKTYVITQRIAYLLEQKIQPEKIIVLTFTQKAAEQMRRRIQDLLPAHQTSQITMGTFHSIAWQCIQTTPLNLPENLQILDSQKQQEFFKIATSIYSDINPQDKYTIDAHELQREYSKTINLEQEFIPNSMLEQIADIYADLKARHECIDFDDLLILWREILSDPNHNLRDIKHVLVDEYQDVTCIQANIVNLLSQNAALFVVGDEAQSIYSFRGVQHDVMSRLYNQPQTKTYNLNVSHRNPPQVLDIANKVRQKLHISNNIVSAPCLSDLSEQVFSIQTCNIHQEAQWVTDQALRLMQSGVPFHEQVALVRRHQDARTLAKTLKTNGIPISLDNPSQNLESQQTVENANCFHIHTIHSAKGLEWSAVFILGLVEDRFPLQRCLSSPDAEQEERRLFYVACTRARRYLYLCYYVSSLGAHSKKLYPSRYIQELPHTISTYFDDVQES